MKKKNHSHFFFSIMKLRKHKGGREGGTFQPNQDMVIKWGFFIKIFLSTPSFKKYYGKLIFVLFIPDPMKIEEGVFFRKNWTHLANLYTLSYKSKILLFNSKSMMASKLMTNIAYIWQKIANLAVIQFLLPKIRFFVEYIMGHPVY